jgi:hypothetical protein
MPFVYDLKPFTHNPRSNFPLLDHHAKNGSTSNSRLKPLATLLATDCSAFIRTMECVAPGSLLQDFGIKQSYDRLGKTIWTIDVIDEADTRSACFDQELGNWKLENVTQYQPLSVRSKSEAISTGIDPTSLSKASSWIDALYQSHHVDLFRRQDWAASALGHYSTWSHALRLYTHMLFSDSRAAAIYWGPKRISIYNEHLPPLIGTLHPILMTRSFEEVKPSLWDFFVPLFNTIGKEQHGSVRNELELPIMRNGYLEETWRSWGRLLFLCRSHSYHRPRPEDGFDQPARTIINREHRTNLATFLRSVQGIPARRSHGHHISHPGRKLRR